MFPALVQQIKRKIPTDLHRMLICTFTEMFFEEWWHPFDRNSRWLKCQFSSTYHTSAMETSTVVFRTEIPFIGWYRHSSLNVIYGREKLAFPLTIREALAATHSDSRLAKEQSSGQRPQRMLTSTRAHTHTARNRFEFPLFVYTMGLWVLGGWAENQIIKFRNNMGESDDSFAWGHKHGTVERLKRRALIQLYTY